MWITSGQPRVGGLQWIWGFAKIVWFTLTASVAMITEAKIKGVDRESCRRRVLRWANHMLEVVRLRVEVHNPNRFDFQPGRPYIIMSNHASFYDIPLIYKALGGYIRMIAKKELFEIPIWGAGMRAGEFLSIDRDNREQAVKDLEAARRLMQSGIIIWIAPEGTRSRDGLIKPFKKGGFVLALQTGATILPVGIRGSEKVIPPDTWNVTLGCTAHVHIGTPVDASAYSTADRDRLMREVEDQIRELAGRPRLEGAEGAGQPAGGSD